MQDGFRFAVGIEDTFVPHAFPGFRALDEYELTQHNRFWSEDLGLAAATGAGAIRYGLPWYHLNPAPGRFVWDWADRVVDRLDELGLEAIVDLSTTGPRCGWTTPSSTPTSRPAWPSTRPPWPSATGTGCGSGCR